MFEIQTVPYTRKNLINISYELENLLSHEENPLP